MGERAWIALGRVERAHGIRGEVRIKLHNPGSRTLDEKPVVCLVSPGGLRRAARLERVRFVPGGAVIAKFEGVDGRDAAEALRGTAVEAERESLPDAEPSEFYVCDLIGAEVVGPAGRLGIVEGVESYPSADALVVRTCRVPAVVEVPLIDDFVERVTLEERKVFLYEAALSFFEP